MRVAIYGAGAMGTVLGAYISKAGYQIDLINRNKEHVKRLQEHGAQIIGTTTFTQEVTALLPEEMQGTYDIILLMTKQRYNREILDTLLPFLHETSVVCTMQNGIPEPSIAAVVGKDRTVGCTMSWGATLHGNGVSELTSEASYETLSFSIGTYGNTDNDKFDYIITLLRSMGKVTLEHNFIGARWAKLLVNAAFSGLSVVTGATFGELVEYRQTKHLALKAIKECIEVAKAANIKIEPIQGKDVVKLMDYHNPFKKAISLLILPMAMKKHKNIRSSMLRDLALGRNTEIDAINGVVCSYGKDVGVPTPINDQIVTIVKAIERKELEPNWNNLTLFK